MATNYMTENGLNKLKEELEHLETVERAYISKQIAE
ncbi:MAG TPA: transcription elongation factor GreA, partial [Bacteroidales bacterium]|nr:transcription elongation factor GreA [Bacteroidales bacterium]